MNAILFTRVSSNAKTGPIPVSTTDRTSCPAACPLRGNGCYAEQGNLGRLWRKLTDAGPDSSFMSGVASVKTLDWSGLVRQVRKLAPGQLWRHNQAGDLPHTGGRIHAAKLKALVAANRGKKGFTYTHHTPTAHNARAIAQANDHGFTINLSANNPNHADRLADLDIAPVVTILPSSIEGNVKLATPAGRRIVVCPATYREDVTCQSCGLCQVRNRPVVIGFPAHGSAKRKASELASLP